MKKLVWDDELATIAQSWASQCVSQHNSQRSTQSSYDFVGENNFYYWGAVTPSPSDIVGRWASGSSHYNSETFGCSELSCFDYKQLVLADAEKLGCGESSCSGVTYVVCDYAPGSYMDAQPYMIGSACSQCAEGYTCENGLCAK